jgi:hypothetical protein
MTAMDWSLMVSTFLGAVIGVGSTLLADRARSRRDADAKDLDALRALYTEFLGTLNRTSEALFSVAAGRVAKGTSRDAAAHEAFQRFEVYTVRERLIATGTESVILAGDVAFHRLRDLRDTVADGSGLGSERHSALLDLYGDALRSLRDGVRVDLKKEPLKEHISG